MNKTKIILLFSLIFLSCTSMIIAQSNKVLVKSYFKNLSKDKGAYFDKQTYQSLYKDKEIISLLTKYLKEDKDLYKRAAIKVMTKIGSNHVDTESRQRAVFQLISVIENAPVDLRREIASSLQNFLIEDFDEASKNKLVEILNFEHIGFGGLIEIAGFLKLTLPLYELRIKYKDEKDLRKYFGMALIRCGDEQLLETLMRKVEEQKLDDNFIYNVIPTLIYTRQKQIFDFLFDIILSNDKACTSNETSILCGFRVMEQISPYIIDFPVKVGVSGDLETDNYRQALEDVRAWIKANRDTYRLRTDIY
jgi:hypothetical protein